MTEGVAAGSRAVSFAMREPAASSCQDARPAVYW